MAVLLTKNSSFIIGPIAQVLGYILDFIYKIGVTNLGLAIILFTCVVYCLMIPLTFQQQKFSKLSSIMNPEIQAIQKKYKDKRDQASMMRMQEETKAVYEKYGTSQTGGCLQLLITFPLLIGFYRVVNNIPAYIPDVKAIYDNNGVVSAILNASSSVKTAFMEMMTQSPINMRGVEELTENNIIDALWKFNSSTWEQLKTMLPDMSSKISTTVAEIESHTKFLCYNIVESPMVMLKSAFADKQFLLVFAAILIPVLAGLTQWYNLRLMPQTPSGNAEENPMGNSLKTMNMVMPLFSVFIGLTLPVGLGLYWIVAAIFRSIQQVVINRYLDKMDMDEFIAKNKAKAEKKRRRSNKKGVSEDRAKENANQITRSAGYKSLTDRANTGNTAEGKGKKVKGGSPYSEYYNPNAKPGSLAARANMVRYYNEGIDINSVYEQAEEEAANAAEEAAAAAEDAAAETAAVAEDAADVVEAVENAADDAAEN